MKPSWYIFNKLIAIRTQRDIFLNECVIEYQRIVINFTKTPNRKI